MQCPRTCDRRDACCARAFCRLRFGACMGATGTPFSTCGARGGGQHPQRNAHPVFLAPAGRRTAPARRACEAARRALRR
eukprot:1451881-Pleurochrysis_carterae.AAC.1